MKIIFSILKLYPFQSISNYHVILFMGEGGQKELLNTCETEIKVQSQDSGLLEVLGCFWTPPVLCHPHQQKVGHARTLWGLLVSQAVLHFCSGLLCRGPPSPKICPTKAAWSLIEVPLCDGDNTVFRKSRDSSSSWRGKKSPTQYYR